MVVVDSSNDHQTTNPLKTKYFGSFQTFVGQTEYSKNPITLPPARQLSELTAHSTSRKLKKNVVFAFLIVFAYLQ